MVGMPDIKETHMEQFQTHMRTWGRNSPGPLVPTEVPKDAILYLFIYLLLYRDKKAPPQLKFSYFLFCEFKPFAGADNWKWKLAARMSGQLDYRPHTQAWKHLIFKFSLCKGVAIQCKRLGVMFAAGTDQHSTMDFRAATPIPASCDPGLSSVINLIKLSCSNYHGVCQKCACLKWWSWVGC